MIYNLIRSQYTLVLPTVKAHFCCVICPQMIDVIKSTGDIQLKSASSDKGVKVASGITGNPCILHGSQISDIQLTELTSGKPLYSLGNNPFYIVTLKHSRQL